MSSGNKHPKSAPYQTLGEQLKRLRKNRSESLAEVSGAVEIDVETLNTIETGKDRPTEDILLLLISHFAAKEDMASKLWELAGYDETQTPSSSMDSTSSESAQQVMVMPNDARIAYTDMVHVMANNYGVVINFMQGSGPNNQPLTVSRIGMSKEHAKSVIKVLQKTLEQAESKKVASPKDSHRPKNPRKK